MYKFYLSLPVNGYCCSTTMDKTIILCHITSLHFQGIQNMIDTANLISLLRQSFSPSKFKIYCYGLTVLSKMLQPRDSLRNQLRLVPQQAKLGQSLLAMD